MSNPVPFITPYSGDQVDKAISMFMNTKYSRRVNIAYNVSSTDWVECPPGYTYKYQIIVRLTGIYGVGDYPIIYFMHNNIKYNLDYEQLSNIQSDTPIDYNNRPLSPNTPAVRIYSNINFDGKIIEIANISSSNQYYDGNITSDNGFEPPAHWSESASYAEGDYVLFINGQNAGIYVSLHDNNRNHNPGEPGSGFWRIEWRYVPSGS